MIIISQRSGGSRARAPSPWIRGRAPLAPCFPLRRRKFLNGRGGAGARAGNKVRHADSPSSPVCVCVCFSLPVSVCLSFVRSSPVPAVGRLCPGTDRTRHAALLALFLGGASTQTRADSSSALDPRVCARARFVCFLLLLLGCLWFFFFVSERPKETKTKRKQTHLWEKESPREAEDARAVDMASPRA